MDVCPPPRASEPPVFNNAVLEECREKFELLEGTWSQPTGAQLQALTERAVRVEGSCIWVGYDVALDFRARAIGRTARFDDDRLFFARLRCGQSGSE